MLPQFLQFPTFDFSVSASNMADIMKKTQNLKITENVLPREIAGFRQTVLKRTLF